MSARLTPRPSRRAVLTVLLAASVLVIAVAAGSAHGMSALSAAGLTGTAPGRGAHAFKQLIDTLKGNAIWLMATGIGLATVVIGLMYFVGSIRAPDYVMKIAMGLAFVLVVGPGIAS